MNGFAALLSERLKRRGELARLAAESGVGPQVIGRWRDGVSRPSTENLEKIAPVLGVSYLDLLRMCGYLPTSEDEPVESVLEVSGPVTTDEQRGVELVFEIEPSSLKAWLELGEKLRRPVQPTSPQRGKRTRLRLVPSNARSRGHLDIRAARRQAGWSDRSAGWRARLAALPQASGF